MSILHFSTEYLHLALEINEFYQWSNKIKIPIRNILFTFRPECGILHAYFKKFLPFGNFSKIEILTIDYVV